MRHIQGSDPAQSLLLPTSVEDLRTDPDSRAVAAYLKTGVGYNAQVPA